MTGKFSGYWSLPGAGLATSPESLARDGSNVQEVNVTDIISEGPIEGLVNGEASIYLEGDQLSDSNTAASISPIIDSYDATASGNPAKKITIPAASGANQPVTATLLDASGNTTYLIDEAETATNPRKSRWLTIFGVTSQPIRVIEYKPTIETTLDLTAVGGGTPTIMTPGYARVQGWDSNTAQDIFAQYHKDSPAMSGFKNLKPIARIQASSKQILKGSITQLYTNANFDTVDSSGGAQAAQIDLWGVFPNAYLENDVWSATYSTRIAHLYIDWVTLVDIKVVNNNKVIYIPKWTNNFSITAKPFALSSENIQKAGTGASSATSNSPNAEQPLAEQKYPGSSFEFRTGNLQQAPLSQIGGVGVASFPVTLTSSQMEIFQSSNLMNTTAETNLTAGYPHEDDSGIVTGMAQKTIVLSQSFSGAQISEIDELKIHFEFPSGHYTAYDNGDERFSAAAFQILVYASESGGANPNDWAEITGRKYNYTIINRQIKKKSSVSYIYTIPISTHLRMRDLKLRITRLTTNGSSVDNPFQLVGSGNGFLKRGTASEVAAVVNDVKISQIVATIYEKQTYPFTALASVNFTSKSFASPPKRAYHVRGLKVKIPSNYTPRHLSSTGKAIYTGIWNGEFSDEGTSNSSTLDIGTYYTDNPAWVFYDILINNRYGLGKFLQQQDINKFQLYKIAKYCDEEVTNVDGTTEPRFTANLYLTKSKSAYKVLKDMATIFRGMVYWLNGQIHPVEDAPATPVYNFSKSNIIDGQIQTESTGSKTRANQWTVIWNNPLAAYKQEPLVMEDRTNILQTGRIISKKAVAFGCTSEGQAIRYGRWKAWTAVNQTEILSFKTSINAAFLKPGDVINVQDVDSMGVHFSGRITASSNSAITLDRDIATISDEAQTDGGRTRGFEFGTTGNGYSYKLTLLLEGRKVVSEQDSPIVVTHGGTTYTYNRGDEVTYAKVNGTSMALVGSDTNEQIEKNILNLEDDSGNHINVEFRNSTLVDSRDFDSTDVSVVGGVTQIAIGSAFTDTIPTSTIWAIREIYNGVDTSPSYKEYKILGLKEDKDRIWQITAVEFYNSKYTAIDVDYTLAVLDPVNPPEQAFVPAPEAVYILQTSDFKSQLEELTIQWEAPKNSDGTDFTNISKYTLQMNPPIGGVDLIEISNSSDLSYRVLKVPNGVHNFGVQAFTKGGKRSKVTWASIDVYDKYKVSCHRTKEGVPEGIRANTSTSDTGSTFTLDTRDWAIQSVGAPGTKVNNANQSTVATHQQVLTAMATTDKEITTAFIYFDADATTDYFKLVTHTAFKCENTLLKYWQEYDQFVSNSENVWTDCTNSADARVKLHKYSNKVEKSDGTTAFTTRFQVGDLIRIKTASNTYYGGKVAFIQSDDVLFTEEKLNVTSADLTSVDESKAIARNALRPDVANDAVVAKITRSGTNYTHTLLRWDVDKTLTGLRALIIDSNVAFLNYNSSAVLQNEIAITLTADALAYDDPEFIITGNGFTQGNPAVSGSAQSSYIDSSNNAVTGQTLTWPIHDGSGGIDYDSGSSLDFSVTVREEADESESRTKTFKIVKVQDGSIGLDGKTARLDLSDYSILYNDNGQGPKFTGTTSVGGTVGEVTLNTKKEGSETNGWIKITVNTTNFTDPVFRIYYGSSPTYLVDSITQYSGWMDGTAGASTVVHYPVPTGYSNNLTTGSSVNINVDVAEKPANFNSSNLPASGDIKATDSCSLISLVDGEVGRTISVSNPTHVFQAANDGTVESETKTGSGTTLEFLKGGVPATYVGGTGSHSYNSGSSPDPNEWRIKSAVSTDTHLTVGTPTGVSNNIVTIGDHAVTGGIDDTETITYTLELGTKDGVKEYKAVQVFAKAKAGETPNNTGIVYMYKVASSTPTIGSDFPDVTVGLTGTNSGKITSATNNQIGTTGWFIVPQSPGTDDLYVVAATFNGTGSSDTIAYSEWTEATPISGTDGAAGTHGLSTGVSTLYKRTNSDSVPAGPSGNLTYTFSTAAVTEGSGQSGNLNGWSATAQSPDNNNKFQWRTTAAAIATATQSTDTIASNEWSGATISAQYVKGDEGDKGLRTIQGYLYYEKTGNQHASAPPAPSGNTYTFSTGVVTGTGIGTGTNTWTNVPRPQAPDAAETTHWTVRYFGTEAAADSSTIGVSYSGVVQYTNFTGVVTFSGGTFKEGGTDITTIDGGNITTGRISSASSNYGTDANGNFSTSGTHLDLTNGRIRSPHFYIDSSGAKISGAVEAKSGFLGSSGAAWRIVGYNIMGGGFGTITSTTGWPNANVTLDSQNSRIIIRETTSATAGVNRVTLGNLS